MPADRSYVAQNTAQRDRLSEFVERASDKELEAPMPAGWTVAAVLAHLAFWDQRIVVLVDAWQRAGATQVPSTVADHDVDCSRCRHGRPLGWPSPPPRQPMRGWPG